MDPSHVKESNKKQIFLFEEEKDQGHIKVGGELDLCDTSYDFCFKLQNERYIKSICQMLKMNPF